MIYQDILNHLHLHETVESVNHVLGGCINQTVRCTTEKGHYFIKTTTPPPTGLFEKEEMGLLLLQRHSELKVPNVLGQGTTGNTSFLVLEWVETGAQKDSFWIDLGQKLALQHKKTYASFGLDYHNHIGRLPQTNNAHATWSDFFIHERLIPQLKLAQKGGHITRSLHQAFDRFIAKLPSLIPHEPPALLHGDLWSGNVMCGENGEAVIFDPAVYYGHREAEIAFTTLFGGFDQAFYQAYHETYPLQSGFEDRIEIHNLYPLLVHVNLFGSSYLGGIDSTLKKFS